MLRSRRSQSVLLACTTLVLWGAALAAVGRLSGLVGSGDNYSIPLWVARRLPVPWLAPVARRLGGGYRAAGDTELVDFFQHTSALSAAETELAYAQSTGRDEAGAERAVSQRLQSLRALQRPAEARLAEELTDAARREHLDAPVPLLTGLRVVWPPVNFSFDLPPYVLIRSRRDRIELIGTTLLRSDLGQDEIADLEQSAEHRGESALVVRVGGVAAYPSIVEEDDNYSGTLDLISHEWMHQYLFFHPLGIRYFASGEMTTINETVANMAGQELAKEIRAHYSLVVAPRTVHPDVPPPDRAVDVDRTLHQLRVDVDDLLAQGRVAEAQTRMDTTQRFLVEHGYFIPRINQAYFAFYGAYADTAASTSPLGPQLATLRSHYATLGDFIHAVQNVTSVSDLQRLLAAAR